MALSITTGIEDHCVGIDKTERCEKVEEDRMAKESSAKEWRLRIDLLLERAEYMIH